MKILTENELSREIIGYAIEVNEYLGSDLLEIAIQECLITSEKI